MSKTSKAIAEIHELSAQPSTQFYTLNPNATHIITYDTNSVSSSEMRQMADNLQHRGIFVQLIGYDGAIVDSPLRIFEVQK